MQEKVTIRLFGRVGRHDEEVPYMEPLTDTTTIAAEDYDKIKEGLREDLLQHLVQKQKNDAFQINIVSALCAIRNDLVKECRTSKANGAQEMNSIAWNHIARLDELLLAQGAKMQEPTF